METDRVHTDAQHLAEQRIGACALFCDLLDCRHHRVPRKDSHRIQDATSTIVVRVRFSDPHYDFFGTRVGFVRIAGQAHRETTVFPCGSVSM